MSVTFSGYTARCEVQTGDFGVPFRAVNGSSLRVPAGVPLRLELLFKDGGDIKGKGSFSLCTAIIGDKMRTVTYSTCTTSVFYEAVTAETWADGTEQHCVLNFTANDMALPLPTIAGTEFYLLLVVTDNVGGVLSEAWARLIVVLDHYPDTDLPIQPGNIIPAGVSYDAAGRYALTTEDGIYYKWTDGANDTGVINGIEVLVEADSNSNFIADLTTQSITGITRVGAVATATKIGHGYLDTDYVTITGATPTLYNGTFAIFNKTNNTFDYTMTGTPAGSATGTLLGTTNTMLTGTAGELVTAIVRKSPYLTGEEVQALINALLFGAYGRSVYGGTVEPEEVQAAPQWSHYTQIDGNGVIVRDWVRAIGADQSNPVVYLDTGWI